MKIRFTLIFSLISFLLANFAYAQSTIESCRDSSNQAICVGKILETKIDSISHAVGAVTPIPLTQLHKVSVYSNQLCSGLLGSTFVPKQADSAESVMELRRACNDLKDLVPNGSIVRTFKIGNTCTEVNPPLANFQVGAKCVELATEQGG